jgi:hypothetical protein
MDWVRERTEEVEDCADGNFFPDCGGVFHPRVPFSGIEEGVVRFLIDMREIGSGR